MGLAQCARLNRSAKAVIAITLLALVLVAAVPAAFLVGIFLMIFGHVVAGLALFGGGSWRPLPPSRSPSSAVSDRCVTCATWSSTATSGYSGSAATTTATPARSRLEAGLGRDRGLGAVTAEAADHRVLRERRQKAAVGGEHLASDVAHPGTGIRALMGNRIQPSQPVGSWKLIPMPIGAVETV